MEEAEAVLNHDTPVTHCLSLDNCEDALKDILEGDNLLDGCVTLCEVEQQKEALGGGGGEEKSVMHKSDISVQTYIMVSA